ncbi:hypothetical protein ABBQ38_013277 [Trebouxia sp. C0009 RCD-2024]
MASSGLLAGKRCLVTGGNRGIGRAVAEAFAREGASLALLARNKALLEEAADSCKSQGAAKCEIYPFDLVNTGDINSLAKQVLADEQVDVLVNNAGILTAGSAFEGDMTDWERCLKLNMLAPMALTHAFSPAMVKRKVSQLCEQTESNTKSSRVLLNRQYELINTCVCDGHHTTCCTLI